MKLAVPVRATWGVPAEGEDPNAWPIQAVRTIAESPGELTTDEDICVLILQGSAQEGTQTLRWLATQPVLAHELRVLWTGDGVTEEGWQLLVQLPALLQLRVALPSGTGEGVGRLHSLKSLEWHGALSVAAAREIASLPELSVLALDAVHPSTDEHLLALADSKIRFLWLLGGNSFGDEGVSALGRMPNLQRLEFSQLHDISTRAVLEALSAPRLEHLVLFQCARVDAKVIAEHAKHKGILLDVRG